MSKNGIKDEKIPLLVKIQTIDVEKLDFKSSIAKNKLVTYVEGTNRFLFVGCTTGTIYVFSRDSQQFLFIIPFKGGKVCGISCAEDETDVAVGSLRGNVTIYRLKSIDTGSLYPSSSVGQITVKPVYTVTHHRNNEITEMQWSPNGRYLFIGDTQGIISQVDVGSLEEFPRPPPSRVILQVQSRVLQLSCVFPYLAINTLAGVFLCDIENEDFTRVYGSDRRSVIKATGVCLVVHPELKTDDSHSVSLYVGCLTTNSILRYGMQGNLISSHEISTSAATVFPHEISLFDPKKQVDLNVEGISVSDSKVSLGKLYATDEGHIISVSNHRITVFEPTTSEVKLILWNDEFRRISSLKVLSNYLFVWETGKLNVVALTEFQTYGFQLLRANLHSVLENWIRHALNSVGWSEETEKKDGDDDEEGTDSRLCVQLFSSMMMGMSTISEETEFYNFVMSHVPISLKETLASMILSHDEDEFDSESSENVKLDEEASPPSDTVIALRKLSTALKEIIETMEGQREGTDNEYFACWKVVVDFYSEIEAQVPVNMKNEDEDSVIFKQSLFQSKVTLENVLQSAISFLKQPCLVSVATELDEMIVERQQIRNSLSVILQEFLAPASDAVIVAGGKDVENTTESTLQFVKYGHQNVVRRWLKDFMCTSTQIEADTYLAELLLLLLPMCYWTEIENLPEHLLKLCRGRVFSWLVVLVSSKVCSKLPFDGRLTEFLLSKIQGNAINEIISSIYEDFVQSSMSESEGPIYYLHHFASVLHFKSATKNSKSKILSALITNLPLKNRTEEEVKEIALRICDDNRMLVEMYKEACLTDGNSQALCRCLLPEFFGVPRLFMIAKTQRILEEVILEILITSDCSSNNKFAFKFAMQRLLLDKYFQIVHDRQSRHLVNDRVNLEIVFRSGQCHLLHKYMPFSLPLLNICMELHEKLFEDPHGMKKCLNCSQPLKNLPNFRTISWDCLGIWMLNNAGLSNLQSLLDVLRTTPKLNSPGVFSLRFYRHLVRLNSGNGDALDEESVDYETITRSRLNSANSRLGCVVLMR